MQSRVITDFIKARNRQFLSLVVCLYFSSYKAQSISNYVANGNFEDRYSCSPYYKVKNWTSTDSLCMQVFVFSECGGQVPSWNGNYQYPHSGEAYFFPLLYYVVPPTFSFKRSYAKNRLKSTLQAGKTYCVKFYVNISNPSTHGIDGFGAYFGSSEIDTITKCKEVLSYITPQIQNPYGNVITDTLRWIPITGTFVAGGTEKYLLLGNFLSDANTDTLMINSTNLPIIFTEGGIDDVSCIEVDLPAYAGRDTTIYLGDSAYIGREPDFAIDSGCVWYQLPNTTTAIDTISGMWVKPNATGSYTYVVRQELECSAVKWDTVVVTVRDFDVGIGEVKNEKLEVKIYPSPASQILNVELGVMNEKQISISVYDILGKAVKDEDLKLTNGKAEIDVSALPNGMYMICFTDNKNRSTTKKLVVAKQ